MTSSYQCSHQMQASSQAKAVFRENAHSQRCCQEKVFPSVTHLSLFQRTSISSSKFSNRQGAEQLWFLSYGPSEFYFRTTSALQWDLRP